jgi:transposase
VTVRAIRAVARRALMLEAEAAEHETELEELVTDACADLLELPGVGTITAAAPDADDGGEDDE